MTLDWEKIASLDFVYDGGLRDIYVFDTDLELWNKVLDAILRFDPQPIYTEDNVATEIPDCVEKIFEKRAHLSPMLTFTIGKFLICCHFFGSKDDASQIEFDLSPDEMTCADDLKSIVGFMHFLANLTQKKVILALESAPELPILECQPNSQEVSWISFNNGFFVSIPAFIIPSNTPEKLRPWKVSLRVQLETEEDQILFQTLVPQITKVLDNASEQIHQQDHSGSQPFQIMKRQLLDLIRGAAPDIAVKNLVFDKIEWASG